MTELRSKIPPIRRVVTGHNSEQVAKALFDGPPANVKASGTSVVATTVWTTFETPAEIVVGESIEDMGNRAVHLAPPAGGSRFAIVDFLPGNSAVVHRTDTIDYAVVITGEIDMELDNSTLTLKAGDVLVQRGTNHAWANRGTVPARIAFVLIDAKAPW